MKAWKLILAALLLLALLIGWQGPKWLQAWNAERAEEAQLFIKQGSEYGSQHNQQACLDRALTKLTQQDCDGNTCTINQGLFLKACLAVAEPSATFCEGVPPYRLKPLEDESEWARFFCSDREISHDGCRFLLRRQQYFCSDGVAADAASAEGK
ncbi:hypothetical protein [Marinobacterium arenosum]|uniref:hypothetical protein n=1 Tax=Marinobacterium arenosum TaxID=2862496 RepID=UPI001C95EF39|nr:hypothetical protein [Marinobacterium arenosum]MBY4676542.1 hypothetical protein [Marinobacterium arenosum]